ncbi:uncharacterized protein LOC114533828 [Dendronephthya gigantea]|uniref:uncharacterized protein LOC114533828 n=1 Tax=Dendronephthya gigantea TaxID=151771 RepID=UPI00106C4B2D|nr:uncharacterized protein LOC114533828 [Dendronephthya gigantea]
MMASKRKRPNDEQTEQSTKINSSEKKIPSGSIVECSSKEEQQKRRILHCPKCDNLVFHDEINTHLDNGCISLEPNQESEHSSEGQIESLTGIEGGKGVTEDCAHKDVEITPDNDEVKSDQNVVTTGNVYSKAHIKAVNANNQVPKHELYYLNNFLFPKQCRKRITNVFKWK